MVKFSIPIKIPFTNSHVTETNFRFTLAGLLGLVIMRGNSDKRDLFCFPIKMRGKMFVESVGRADKRQNNTSRFMAQCQCQSERLNEEKKIIRNNFELTVTIASATGHVFARPRLRLMVRTWRTKDLHDGGYMHVACYSTIVNREMR